jgi:hypothetical protein
VAPSKRDGSGSSHLGVAHHGERSLLGSMLGLGRTSGYLIGMRCWSLRKALNVMTPNLSSGKGRTDRSARVPEHTDEWAISPARNWAFFELIRQMTRGQ